MTIQLPEDVAAALHGQATADAYVKVLRGVTDFLGETHFVALHGALYVLTRSSMFAPLAPFLVAASAPLRLVQESFQSILILRAPSGAEHKIPLLGQERELEALILLLSGGAPMEAHSALQGDRLPGLPQQRRPQEIDDEDDDDEPEDDDDLESSEDEDDDDDSERDEDEEKALIEEAIEALDEKRYSKALELSREAMQVAGQDDLEDYKGLLLSMEALRDGDPVRAFFLEVDAGYIYQLTRALKIAIAKELEVAGEPLLALASYDDSSEAAPFIERLKQTLNLTEEEIEAKTAERHLVWYRKVVEAAPSDVDAWEYLAIYLCELKQFEEALSCARRAIELKSDSYDGHIFAAEALCGLGSYAEALEHLSRLMVLNPEDSAAYEEAATIYEHHLGDSSRAIELYYQALSKTEYSSDNIEDALMRILSQAGRVEEVIAFVEGLLLKYHDKATRRSALREKLSSLYLQQGEATKEEYLRGLPEDASVEQLKRVFQNLPPVHRSEPTRRQPRTPRAEPARSQPSMTRPEPMGPRAGRGAAEAAMEAPAQKKGGGAGVVVFVAVGLYIVYRIVFGV